MGAVIGPPRYRMLGWIAVVGAALCVAVIVVTTFLLPGGYDANGGFLPIPAPTAAGR
jgi:hypothetical protein